MGKPFSIALPVASNFLATEEMFSDVINGLRNARSRALIATKIQTKAAGGEVQRGEGLLIAEQWGRCVPHLHALSCALVDYLRRLIRVNVGAD